jgi:hypothetical protein
MPAPLFMADGCYFEGSIDTPNPAWYPAVKFTYRVAGPQDKYLWSQTPLHSVLAVGADIVCRHLGRLLVRGDDGKTYTHVDLTPELAAGLHAPLFDGLLNYVLGIIAPKGNPVPKFGGASGSPSSTPSSPDATAPTAAGTSTTTGRGGAGNG